MGKRYGTETEIVQINVKIQRDAKAILDKFASGPKAHGRLLDRLLFEHAVRQEMQDVIRGKEEVQVTKTV
jgi:hypothetical protein